MAGPVLLFIFQDKYNHAEREGMDFSDGIIRIDGMFFLPENMLPNF